MKHGRFAPFVSFRPGCCRVPVCLIYEPDRRRIANAMVVNDGKTIENGLRVRFGHPSRNFYLYFAFVAACGPLQTHFHRRGHNWKQLPFAFTTPSREKVAQKRPQTFLSNKSKILFPLKMPKAARRAFPIVLLKTLPCRGRRRFRPAAPQCAAAGCTLPHARCGWVRRS